MTNTLCPEDDQLLMAIRQAAIDAQRQLQEERNIARGVSALASAERGNVAFLSRALGRSMDYQADETLVPPKGMEDIDPLRAIDAMLKTGDIGAALSSSGSHEQDVKDSMDDSLLFEDEALLSTLYSDSEGSEDSRQDAGSDAGGSDMEHDYNDEQNDGFDDIDGLGDDDSDGDIGDGSLSGKPSGDSDGGTTAKSGGAIARYDEVSAAMMQDFGLKKTNGPQSRSEILQRSGATPGKAKEKSDSKAKSPAIGMLFKYFIYFCNIK
jgi:hypothetical protein